MTKDVTPPPFDGERAFEYLEAQVAFGPRLPGSQASANCRDYMYEHFQSAGLMVDSQRFMYFDPYSSTDTPMVNVIARFRQQENAEHTVVLMAHYDSRPRTDSAFDSLLREQPLDGANDGASGVAVLMELANLFGAKPPSCNVDLVLVDGEDWGKAGDHENYLIGSKHFATSGIRDKYRFGIVVDMIGDSRQEIFREDLSQMFNPTLNDMVWKTASELNISTFRDTIGHRMIDDHLSLNVGGVPSVLIIDFNYPYWHTEFDLPDRCSAESLSNVGRVLARIVYTPSSWPEQK